MTALEKYSEQFRFELELFVNACDAFEQEGRWDAEEKGQMEAYYQNDILSFILRLIAADGVNEQETAFLNKTFGFDYTKDELAEVYSLSKEALGDSFEDQLRSSLDELESLDEKLYEHYVALFRLICKILTESDASISAAERRELETLRDIFGE